MPKWVYPLAILFVLFLIYTDPARSGVVASGFASFLVNLVGAIGQFLGGIFEGAGADAPATLGTDPITTVTSQLPTTAPSVAGSSASFAETFTHTHDGVTHTHTYTSTTLGQ